MNNLWRLLPLATLVINIITVAVLIAMLVVK